MTCISTIHDVIYIPKGYIHQFSNESSSSSSQESSLILCIYMNVHSTIATILDTLLPQALSHEIIYNPTIRKSIPRSFTNVFGVSRSEEENPVRSNQEVLMKGIFKRVMNECMDMLDPVADQVLHKTI
jgi:hypothetical protein